ncbi:MAG: threonine synthase [Oligoflexales bacterium]|nr:threonine synthase [Oligoflexales bacterium]
MKEHLRCIECGAKYDINEVRYSCDCTGLLAVERPLEVLESLGPEVFDSRLGSRNAADRSGVWRFREAVNNLDEGNIVTLPEGLTNLYSRSNLSKWVDCDQLAFKHEGENPSGSFKDRGMTVAVSQAKRLGKKIYACASTGNTSASLALYAALNGGQALVFIPSGKISLGKLSQALAYGATCISITGDFDKSMQLVKQAAEELGIYLVNSLNPFRVEGQKTIIWDILQQLKWQAPDWIITPAGNLGNTSAFGKAIEEAVAAKWITKKPKIAAIQASGANPFATSFKHNFESLEPVTANTVASAIQIGNPVNFPKAKRTITQTNGLVEQVTDKEILEAKYMLDKNAIGCEPASACSLAGLKKLRQNNTIKKTDSVVCILTGHILKDTETTLNSLKDSSYNEIVESDGSIDSISKLLK